MNVLSLCDGMSCGQIALKELGIKVDKYYASEIDKNAIKVTMDNFPNTIQLGDVTKLNEEVLKELPKIDLVLFGSPCRSISKCSQTLRNGKDYNNGLKGISGLFVNCVEILNYIKENNNKDVYFLAENVNVSKKNEKDLNKMTELIGVEPGLIDSELFSAQGRLRNYWTNIPLGELPDDEHRNKQVVKDIFEDNIDDKYYYEQEFDYYGLDKRQVADLHIKGFDLTRRVMNPNFKSYTLTACRGGNTQMKVLDLKKNRVRKLTPLEYRRLQTIPDWYKMNVADGHIYNMCGDGWNINTICYLLSYLKGI